jgi:2-keto-4-pentenoate hydratase/2-oxohepta-3-ene-1,7-dioic acid hydratase in catechol pathway
VVVDGDELKRFGDLRLQLRVNGELRQNMLVEGDMIYRPVQALQALSRFQRLDAGDLVLTGTPVGTRSAHRPSPRGHRLLPARGPQVEDLLLRPGPQPEVPAHGDVVEASVATDDGAIDLGTQRTVVRFK